MTIRQVCEQSGVTVDTIRFYERAGLIESEKDDYYKNYSQQTLETLIAIKKLRLAGLSLSEIKWLLSIDVAPEDLSLNQFDSLSAIVDNAIARAKVRAKELAEAQQLLERMQHKLREARNEDK